MADTVVSDWIKLGAFVRQARNERGWTQIQMAQRAGVSRAWLARLESGHRRAELESILRLFTALDLRLFARASREASSARPMLGTSRTSLQRRRPLPIPGQLLPSGGSPGSWPRRWPGHPVERERGATVRAPCWNADWLARTRLLLTTATTLSRGVAPYLHGLLPESESTRERWAIRTGANADDPFGMLASMGWDCPGALQFCRAGDTNLLVSRPGDHVEVNEADIARRLHDLRQDPAY